MAPGREVQQLLSILDQAYNRQSWHGTNLRGSVRGLTPDIASWRPHPGRHNIWEIAVHAAYWKYTALRRLTGAARGSFSLAGSNWFVRPEEKTVAAWRRDVALLDQTHANLREAVSRLTPRQLADRPPTSSVTNFALLSGVAAHDLYHAGQIQLLKRLARA